MMDNNENRQLYYFITVFEKIEIDDLGFPSTGYERCWGFYTDKDVAYQALHENWTDISESMYEYAILEEYYEGISCYTGYRQFFKFDHDEQGYREIDEPEEFKHYCAFAIG